MILVKLTKDMGRGLFAQKPIHQGERIMLCELLVLSAEDSRKIKDTALKHYVFEFNENQDCFVLGLGMLLNHSNTPNVQFRLVEENDRHMMKFIALRDIKESEELFIDYDVDMVEDYLSSQSLMPENHEI